MLLFLRKIVLFPLKIRNKIRNNKIKRAKIALEEGLLASACDEKEKVLISYNKAKKSLGDSTLYLLLKLQYYLIKGNQAQCFNTYKKMLDFSSSRPLAIKGLILIASKYSFDASSVKPIFLRVIAPLYNAVACKGFTTFAVLKFSRAFS